MRNLVYFHPHWVINNMYTHHPPNIRENRGKRLKVRRKNPSGMRNGRMGKSIVHVAPPPASGLACCMSPRQRRGGLAFLLVRVVAAMHTAHVNVPRGTAAAVVVVVMRVRRGATRVGEATGAGAGKSEVRGAFRRPHAAGRLLPSQRRGASEAVPRARRRAASNQRRCGAVCCGAV
jgi:hypothetical protein